MRTLTDREKRTIRIATVGIAIYLVLFFGLRCQKYLEAKRTDYGKVVAAATKLRDELQIYEDKAAAVKSLMEKFHMDPAKLSKASVMADASAAIQNAAAAGGVVIGPIRESPARASAKELGSMQLEGSGPVPAMMAFLSRLETLGFPLVIDSVQISPAPGQQGMIKVNLTIIILDFEQWKAQGAPNA
jgi:hypothetical protein